MKSFPKTKNLQKNLHAYNVKYMKQSEHCIQVRASCTKEAKEIVLSMNDVTSVIKVSKR